MFASARLGMAKLMGRCERFFFMPVDAPAFSVATLTLLLANNTNTPEEFEKMRLYIENRAYT